MSEHSITPKGPAGLAMLGLARLIAECAAFQDEADVDSPEEAMGFIDWPFWRGEIRTPRAIISLPESGSVDYRRLADGVLIPFGTLELSLIRPMEDDSPEAAKDEELAFDNWQAAILEHIQKQSGQNDNLNVVGIDDTNAAARTDPRMVSGQEPEPARYERKYTVNWDPIG